MEAAAFRTIRDKYDCKWQRVWSYYQNLKRERGLSAYDILRQLGGRTSYINLEYLSNTGNQRRPSTAQGTSGRIIWDLLLAGLKKTDWLPAMELTYKEKYYEMLSDGYFQQYELEFLDDNQIIVNIDHQRHDDGHPIHHDREEITKELTIDGIIPNIKAIHDMFWL